MWIEQLFSQRMHEVPKEAQTPGHRLLLRGGYIQQIGQGIYALLPLGLRACRKVERIVREEMNGIGGQEILMPVVTPAEIWERSGRYRSVGPELVRFTDRSDRPNVLNMTHEEVVVELCRRHIASYRQLPQMVYQIQTKFRDEPRSRGGLIRVREFTMKDAYSFHRTQEDLERYYAICHAAYSRIFRRCGLRQLVDIASDSGMMGGKVAHEFMLVTPVGEDTLVLCSACDYRANREIARTSRSVATAEASEALSDVATPGVETIEALAEFFKVPPERCAKAVALVAAVGGEERDVVALVSGNREVNMVKLRNVLGAGDLRPMHGEELARIGSVAGYIGPRGLHGARLIVDELLLGEPALITGANARDRHSRGFNVARDLAPGAYEVADVADVIDGDACPQCGAPLRTTRGVEVGNIFQLGTKYTKGMEVRYAEEDGSQVEPIMGCYGIGIGRTMACVVEESHDDSGPLWPISVAPFEVEIVGLGANKPGVAGGVRELQGALVAAGVDVVADARAVSVGAMLADADLIGAPMRLIVSQRNLAKGVVEVKYRTSASVADLPVEIPWGEAVARVPEVLGRMRREFAFTAPAEGIAPREAGG